MENGNVLYYSLNDKGDLLGISGSVDEAYQRALDADEESFHIVRLTKGDGTYKFNYSPGYLFGDWTGERYGEDGLLKQEVKESAKNEIRSNLGEDVRKETDTTEQKSGYTITPSKYTTKKGKVLDMQLVKFDNELSKEQQRAANSLARDLKGWWSRDDGGFLMRDETTAHQLIDAVLEESGETLADSAPLSLDDMKDAFEDIKPVDRGAFGNIYDQFKGKAKEAIEFLIRRKEGEAVGALHHPEIGDIDLVWGKEGTGKSDGFGLAKMVKFHPEVIENLQDILNDMQVAKRTPNRVAA